MYNLVWSDSMGRKKEVIMYKGRYRGRYLSENDCDKLEKLRELDSNGDCIDSLKHVIYDLTSEDVNKIIEEESNNSVELKVGTLTDSQTVGVAYMYTSKRMILGDSVGLGKTVEVAGLINLLSTQYSKQDGAIFRYLLLTEKALVEKTRDKMVKFTGDFCEMLYGDKDKIEKYWSKYDGELPPNTVGSHSLLSSKPFQEYVIDFVKDNEYPPFDLLIIDECGSILANSTTGMYENGKYFSNLIERVVMLNATSFENSLMNFYNQLNFIDESLLPTKSEFEKTYKEMVYGIKPYPVFKGKYKNGDKFKFLVGYRYLQRTRKSLGATMENCTAEVIISALSPLQKKLINMVSIPNMVWDCPSYFRKFMPEAETNMETTPKLRDLVVLVNRLKSENCGPILVYTRYKEAQACIGDAIKEQGYSYGIMNGETSNKDRTDLVNMFQLGDLDILITNVQKGLDFGNCNYCIFYDYDPNPNKMVQFEGRMTREYDIKDKHVYLLMSKGKELSNFKHAIGDKAQASDIFAGSDYSCVLSILLKDDVLKSLK